MIYRIWRWFKLRRIKAYGPLYVIFYEYLTVWNVDEFGLRFAFGYYNYRLMNDEELLEHMD